VGHVARIFEAAGLATTSIYVRAFRPIAERMTLARTLITRHPMGRPLGAPGDAERQRAAVLAALDLVDTARVAGTVEELPQRYRTTGA